MTSGISQLFVCARVCERREKRVRVCQSAHFCVNGSACVRARARVWLFVFVSILQGRAGDGRRGGRKVQLMVSSNGGRRKEQEKPDWACKRRLLQESDGQTSAAALLLCASLPIKSAQRALSCHLWPPDAVRKAGLAPPVCSNC